MKRLLAAVVAAALTFGTVPATVWAQDEDTIKQVEELSAQAAAAYKEGEYEKAIELFQQAYDLQAVPNLLFNIAKVYEKLENWDEAIANYRKFVTAPDANAQARETALDRIDQLEEAKRLREEEEKRRAEEEQRKKEEEQKRLAEQQNQQEETTTDDEGGSGTTVAWILTGSGIGLLGGGAVFGAIAANQQSRFQTGDSAEVKLDARKKGKTFALVADSMFAAGAVATAVGIVMFAVSGGGESDTETAAVPVGWVGEGEAGIGVHLRF